MNLRDLRYICAVAELGHFGRAARASHVSQPTLSGQIRKLEAELGVTLFERTNRTVRLTEVGAQIVEVAREVLQGADQIGRIARAQRDPMTGPLRLGLIPTIAPYLIPLVVAPLGRRLPALEPIFVEAVTEQLLVHLEAGALDAAVLATDPGSKRLAALALYDEPFWLAMPRGHPLEHAERVDLDDIDPGQVLLLSDGHCLREQALALCRTAAGADRADITATSLETIINLVAAGQGVTLVPALALRGAWTTDLGVIVRPLDDAAAFRTVRLVYRAAFPRLRLLSELARVVRRTLPNTVRASAQAPPAATDSGD